MSLFFFLGFPGFLGSELIKRLLLRLEHVDALCLVQPKFARLWRMSLGFKITEGKKPVYFEGHEQPYIELIKELTPPPNAISEHTDATVLFRIEGSWDAPSAYEIASAA